VDFVCSPLLEGENGMPCSITLGGYDQARFVPHQTNFNLNQSDGMPHALVRGIEITATQGRDTPSHWGTNIKMLSNMNSSFGALIDSSTPYLWLPDAVCDRFADALNLTYSSTFDLYTLTGDQFNSMLKSTFSFTFSLSSSDNYDDFGRYLDTPGVINITISSSAFAQYLKYPFMDETIKFGSPAVLYFPLRRLANSSDAIIGRTFLQESYLLTKYDTGIFSIHQALYPKDPIKAANLKTIDRPPNSPYPAAPPYTPDQQGLSTAQMAGIGAGVFLLCVAILTTWCLCRRKRKGKRRATLEDADKDGSSSIMPETPKTPVSRMFSKIIRKKRSRKTGSVDVSRTHGAVGSEAEADGSHELHELPAPIGPVELDAANDSNSLHGDTELGTERTENLSAYEVARRKLERQLQGPVPAYSPSSTGSEPPPREKSMQDVSPIATYRPGSPNSTSPIYVASESSLPNSLPSPMSPTGDWATRLGDLPSPMTVAPPFPIAIYTGSSNSGPSTLPPVSPHSQTFDPSMISRSNPSLPSRSNSTNAASPSSATGSLVPPSPSYQRTPIDPSRVICLGPLPENVQLPNKPSIPRMAGTRSQSIPLPTINTLPTMNPTANGSSETLGSNFTEVEEQLVEELTRSLSQTTQGQSQTQGNQARSPTRNMDPETPRSQERIDGGLELVHVPQLAEKRYSWEEPDR
jgi:hypothetical protein